MYPGVVRRAIRAFVCTTIITAFIPLGMASAAPSSAGMGTDGVVSVLEQRVYQDAEGQSWFDGVVVNTSEATLKYVQVPVTVIPPVAPLTYEVPTTSEPWTFYGEVEGYLMKPGERSTFHIKLPEEAVGAIVYAGAGGGWAIDLEPFDLEVISVAEGPIPEGEPSVEPATYEEPVAPPAWEPRVYTVTLKNNSTLPAGGIQLFGAEYQGTEESGTPFLDALASCASDAVLQPGETKAFEVRGWAEADADPATSIFTEVYAEAVEQTYISVKFESVAPAYGTGTRFVIRHTRADGSPVLGSNTLKLYWEDGESEGYIKVETTNGSAYGTVRPLERVVYKPVFWGSYRYATAVGKPVAVQPRTEVTTPGIPSVVAEDAVFKATGFIKPDHAAGSREVRMQFYRYEGGKWVLRKTTGSTVYAYPGAYAKYVSRLVLTSPGRWRVRAYHPADGRTRADVSGYDYVTVK